MYIYRVDGKLVEQIRNRVICEILILCYYQFNDRELVFHHMFGDGGILITSVMKSQFRLVAEMLFHTATITRSSTLRFLRMGLLKIRFTVSITSLKYSLAEITNKHCSWFDRQSTIEVIDIWLNISHIYVKNLFIGGHLQSNGR